MYTLVFTEDSRKVTQRTCRKTDKSRVYSASYSTFDPIQMNVKKIFLYDKLSFG